MNSKVLFFILFLGLASFSANAQTTPPVKEKEQPAMQKDKQMNKDKVEVIQKDLPQSVQKTLSSDTYKDWSFKKAYRVKTATSEHYEVIVIKGDQKTTLKLDTNGKIVS
jgi:negative regulator of replication initiation